MRNSGTMSKNCFQQIYEIVKRIPLGRVVTYGQIAEIYNSYNKDKSYKTKTKLISPRLVGWALHANTDQNIPCHRVVDWSGKLALNYAFEGWREQKRRLEKERVGFLDEMHLELGKYQTVINSK